MLVGVAIVMSVLSLSFARWIMRDARPDSEVATHEQMDEESSVDNSAPIEDPAEARRALSAEIRRKLLDSTARILKAKGRLRETDCQDVWAAVELYPFAQAAADKNAPIRLPKIKSCRRLPANLKRFHDDYAFQCRRFSGAKRSKFKAEEDLIAYDDCAMKTLLYRAMLHDMASEDVDVTVTEDLPILFDKLLSALAQQDPIRMEKIATRMHELEPNFYEPLKAMTIARFLGVVEETNEEVKSEKMLALEKSLQEARNFGIYDRELLQVEMMMKTQAFQDKEALREEGERLVEEFPDRGFGHYAVAASHFHNRDFEGTKKALELAVQREPENQSFRQTLDELKRDPSNFNRKIFRVALGLSFDFNDANELKMKQARP